MTLPGKIGSSANADAVHGRRRRRRRIWRIAQRPIGDKAWFFNNDTAVGRPWKSGGRETGADEAKRPDDGQHADRDQKEQRGAHVIDSMCLPARSAVFVSPISVTGGIWSRQLGTRFK